MKFICAYSLVQKLNLNEFLASSKSKIIVHVKPSVFIDQFTNANTLSRTWFITEICSEIQLS